MPIYWVRKSLLTGGYIITENVEYLIIDKEFLDTLRLLNLTGSPVFTGNLTAASASIGDTDGGNYLSIEEDGTIKFNGNATIFDDMRADALTLKVQGVGVSIDHNEAVVNFANNSDLLDYLYINVQIPHGWKVGSTIYPHIHYIQTNVNIPNLLIQYRWQVNGEFKINDWTNLPLTHHAFTYTSGNLNQIIDGAGIIPPVNAELSDIIQFKILRDNSNDSAAFAGIDNVPSAISILSFDIHIEKDTIGSREVYEK